ncbi:Fic family protein [Staphylococcus hominis subsp. hominis]|uniref:Fic family protein n=1 Tax=Staphylococcus hominis TaxID=1290 RepID=UPI001F5D7CC7|nr:Fic/DOC family N-terminal domain-containing protein [Staphylococcus hominis]MCI3136320.1 Fic family protein [Staphylococcus hominis subsp. hominis]
MENVNNGKPFEPKKLPLNEDIYITDKNIISLFSQANRKIGEYRGFLSTIINPMLLISPLISQEAVLSSKLEGTHATLEDLMNYEAGNSVEVERDEMQEIINYRKSLFYALEKIGTINNQETTRLPLTGRIIKEMHNILLNNVRGNTKRRGEYKINQNYIGSNSAISYTPVSPTLTEEYMHNLENYIHYEDFDVLIQSSILHAQFEMIHPFEDGNGRIGRLLIPLFLYYKEVIPYPTFYMSMYFEKDRGLYLEKLDNISKSNGWKEWIEYYLKGVIEQTEYSTKIATEIYNLYEYMKSEIIPQLKSTKSIQLLDYIFSNPIFNAKQIDNQVDLNIRTIYKLLNKLEELGYIQTTDQKRNKTYYCPQLLNIIQIS